MYCEKRLKKSVLGGVFLIMLLLCFIRGATVKAEETILDQGNYGIDWRLTSEGVLYLGGGSLKEPGYLSNLYPWSKKVNKIQKVVVDGKVVLPYYPQLFYNMTNVKEIENIDLLDTSRVRNFSYMFSGAQKLESLDLTTWDTSSANNMFHMFDSCYNLKKLKVGKWDVSNVRSMSGMFDSLASESSMENLDLSSWNVGSLEDMSYMFLMANIRNINLTNWNVSQASNMNGSFSTFRKGESLNLANWQISAMSDIEDFFDSIDFDNLNVSNWPDTSRTNQLMENVIQNNSGLNITGLGYKCVDINELNLSKIESQHYIDQQIKPEIQLLDGSTKLVDGLDFSVQYGWNVVNSGSVTIQGTNRYNNKRKYTGSRTVSFEILPGELSIKENPTATPIFVNNKIEKSSIAPGKIVNSLGDGILGNYSWLNPDDMFSGSGEYEAIFSPNDSNYETLHLKIYVEGLSGELSIKENPKSTPIRINSRIEDSSISSGRIVNSLGDEVSGYYSWSNPNDIVSKSGEYEATFSPNDSNYETLNLKIYVEATPLGKLTLDKNNPPQATSVLPGALLSTSTISNVRFLDEFGNEVAGYFEWDLENIQDEVVREDNTYPAIFYPYSSEYEITPFSVNISVRLGWVQEYNEWYYYQKEGKTTGWLKVNDKYYYFNEDGVMQKSWLFVNGQQYYLDDSGAMQTGWTLISWYTGDSLNPVVHYWYHFDDNGVMQTGWLSKNNQWYYLDKSGVMQTGWQVINSTWYYFDNSGSMKNGWQAIGGIWYYFDQGGGMKSGWQVINGVWYYFDNSGAMKSGWQVINGAWYYFNNSGAMKNGWQVIGGVWYYLDASGAMVTGAKNIGGVVYTFNGSGVWIR